MLSATARLAWLAKAKVGSNQPLTKDGMGSIPAIPDVRRVPRFTFMSSSTKKASLPDIVFRKGNFKPNILSFSNHISKGWILGVHWKPEESIKHQVAQIQDKKDD